MSFWNRLLEKMREPDIEEGRDPDDPDGVKFYRTEEYSPPSDLATLINRVVEYRNNEVRDLRSTSYELARENERLTREAASLKYERDEGLQRLAKIIATLNKKQLAALGKPPVALRFGPPPITVLGFDEGGKYRRIAVPPAATMETVERKGNGPQFAGTVLNSDRAHAYARED